MTSPLPLVRIGTRRSPLALYQTHLIAELLRRAHPTLQVAIVEMDTRGDMIRDIPLPQIGGKGLFTQELEDQLLDGRIELAVHSLKDLPSTLPEGLAWAGSPTRGEPSDCLVSHKWSGLDALPQGALVATGSVRRRAMLSSLRPDLTFTDLRGNIDTRLRKLVDHDYDAILMATTALERLELAHHITERLSPHTFVPAVAQGAIGVEINAAREDIQTLLTPILDPDTTRAARAERAFMRLLEGGCSAPVAAHCARNPKDASRWIFTGWVGAPDGHLALHESRDTEDPVLAAEQMAEHFIAKGARELMRP